MEISITTDRLLLRNFRKEDLNDLYDYSSQDGVGELAGWPHHKTIEESENILNNLVNNEDELAIVYKENNKVIGHIAINSDSENNRGDTKELGYVLNKNYWNQGLMTEVLNAVLEHLFSKNINYVYACCFQNNLASKHLIEKCGFDFEKEGDFYSKMMDKTFDTYEYVFTRDKWNNDLG